MSSELERLLAATRFPADDPEGPPITWRAPRALAGYPIDYGRVRRPTAPDALVPLPDLEGAEMRRRVHAAQSPKDRWLDDHGKHMRDFVHQATGYVPGLHAAQNAYRAYADPDHPVTQSGRSIPKAVGWGLLGALEVALPSLFGRAVTRQPSWAGKTVEQRQFHAGEDILHGSIADEGLPLQAAAAGSISVPGLFGLGVHPSVTGGYFARPNPQTTTSYYPHNPEAVRPQPRRDAASDLAPPERPMTGLRVHPEPIETHHGTTKSFDRFDKAKSRDFGIHSGTPEATQAFVDMGLASAGRVLPLRLGPQDRPFTSLEVKDLGFWQPLDLARELERRGVRFSDDEFSALLASGSKRDGYPVIENALNRHGIDVLRYRNNVEDPGSMSWITWNPETLYSRTTGAQLFGLGAAGAGALAPREDIGALLAPYSAP